MPWSCPYRNGQPDPEPQDIPGQFRLRFWLPQATVLVFPQGKGALGTYLKTYVPFIPKVFVPFPAMEKENLFKHGVWDRVNGSRFAIEWVQRKAWYGRPKEYVESLSLVIVVHAEGSLCVNQLRGRGTERTG